AVECPSCQHRVQVPPDSWGREMACPACGKAFRADSIQEYVTSVRPSVGSSADAIQPSRPRDFSIADHEPDAFGPPIGNVGDWQKVRGGITLIWIATLMAVGLAVLAVVGVFIFAVLAGYDRPGEPPTGYVAMRICVGLALLLILLIKGLQFVGHVF